MPAPRHISSTALSIAAACGALSSRSRAWARSSRRLPSYPLSLHSACNVPDGLDAVTLYEFFQSFCSTTKKYLPTGTESRKSATFGWSEMDKHTMVQLGKRTYDAKTFSASRRFDGRPARSQAVDRTLTGVRARTKLGCPS